LLLVCGDFDLGMWRCPRLGRCTRAGDERCRINGGSAHGNRASDTEAYDYI
jgi:hypothetical protein